MNSEPLSGRSLLKGCASPTPSATLNDFEIHYLESDEVSLGLVPTLGGRIVSLRDRRSGREWLDGWLP